MADVPRKKTTSGVKRKNSSGAEGWPRDAAGKPMVQITFGASELVPTAQYANVTLGPAQATRFVKDSDQAVQEGLGTLAEICETVISEHRTLVIESLRAER